MVSFDTIFPKVGGSSHPHACIIFDDLSCYRKVASKFILEGLSNNEKCIMAIDSYEQSMIAEDFSDAGVNINDYMGKGKLTILDVKKHYSGNGGFNPDQTIKIWQDLSKKATDEGYDALRVVGEATFSIGGPELADKLIYYENIMNEVLFPNYPFKSLCVYDKNLYQPEVIKAAICAHPILFYNDELYLENIHYVPPEIHFKSGNAQDEIDIWLENVKHNNDNLSSLRESEQTLLEAQSIAKLGSWQYHTKNDKPTWSKEMFRIFDRNPEDGEPAWEEHKNAIHPDDWKKIDNAVRTAIFDGTSYQEEFRILCKNGSIRWAETIGKAHKNEYEVVQTISGTVQEITERKKAEIAINNQQSLFETMFNTIPDGVVITNTKREILLANKGMESTFGYKPEELIGKETKILYATQEKFKETGKNVFGTETKKPGDLYITRYKDINGREFSGETFGARLYDEENQWIGNLGIMRDITEREQAEMRIQQAQKMESIGNLAGGIAHDFNNILFPIMGFAEMLTDDLPPGSPERVNAQGILHAGKRGSDLVKQILAFSRQHEHKLIPTRVQQVLKEVLKLTRASIPMNIEINQHLQKDCGLVLADSTQLHQIGMNLITNAYHAVENISGKIDVEVREITIKDGLNDLALPPGGYVMLSVSDNGIGIDKTHLDKIFEPYFTTKEKGKGTGLGLAVVYGILKEHKGEIKVMSEPGIGTAFQVYLPLMKTSEVFESISEPMVMETGTERILLVDDEAPIANLVKQMLERLGYSVSIRTSSVDAMDAFRASPDVYDLVITDMSMPYMTGEQLAQKMLTVRPDIPIIICTGFSERLTEDTAKAMGIKGFLMKPVIKSAMANEVRRVLDESGKQLG